MELKLNKQVRYFNVGVEKNITLADCGKIYLKPNEQLTLITEDNKEYDICRKEWGFYATPSVNGRLKKFNLLGSLVKNNSGYVYLLLVEKNKKELFYAYLEKENQTFIKWLPTEPILNTCICDGWIFKTVHNFISPPEGEIRLNITDYSRSLSQCSECGHIYSIHDYSLSNIYNHKYVDSVYGEKLLSAFNKIVSLPKEKSDNFRRVKRVINFMSYRDEFLRVLDVGSGLCVFLYEIMKKTNWDCYALDPDERQAKHAQALGIKSIHCDFNNFKDSMRFDLITFNKVLEHLEEPKIFLTKAKQFLSHNGIVYIEVPDGEEALKDSPEREEFFIDHYHAFSFRSLAILLESCGFKCLELSRIKEPSGKYTLTCFGEKK